MYIEKEKLEQILDLESLLTPKSIRFPSEQEIVKKIHVIKQSLHLQKISFLNSTKANCFMNTMKNFSAEENLEPYSWKRMIDQKYHKKLSQKGQHQIKTFKLPTGSTEEKIMDVKQYLKAQKIKEKIAERISEDVILVIWDN